MLHFQRLPHVPLNELSQTAPDMHVCRVHAPPLCCIPPPPARARRRAPPPKNHTYTDLTHRPHILHNVVAKLLRSQETRHRTTLAAESNERTGSGTTARLQAVKHQPALIKPS
jgi:hypothetical protein